MALTLAACGGSDGVAPQLPTAPVGPTGARPDPGIVMESSLGLAPAGFKMISHIDPKAGEDGVIRAQSPVTVTFDLCNSTVDDGGHPWFLFDFDFDHVADVIGKADSCQQTHTYRIPLDATRDVRLAANVCFANADPSAHKPGTYFSCRSVEIGLPLFAGAPAGCYFTGTFYFPWPGGVGPSPVTRLFGNPECAEPGDDANGILVVAPNESEAVRRCGTSAAFGVRTDFKGGDFFVCLNADQESKQ